MGQIHRRLANATRRVANGLGGPYIGLRHRDPIDVLPTDFVASAVDRPTTGTSVPIERINLLHIGDTMTPRRALHLAKSTNRMLITSGA